MTLRALTRGLTLQVEPGWKVARGLFCAHVALHLIASNSSRSIHVAISLSQHLCSLVAFPQMRM